MRTLIGTCEICGDEVWEEDGLLLMNSCYRCDRCGRWTCWGCGGYSTGDGYGAEDESKYRSICKDCHYELQAEYAAKWEAEYGDEERARGMENPYDFSEEEKEWRERLRSFQRARQE